MGGWESGGRRRGFLGGVEEVAAVEGVLGGVFVGCEVAVYLGFPTHDLYYWDVAVS